MPPAKYTAAILRPATWGGAIELAVLAAHFATRIDSVDVESGRIDRFEPSSTSIQSKDGGSGGVSGNRCILVYSGIHYDAATLAPMPDAEPEWHQTVFPIVRSSLLIPFPLLSPQLSYPILAPFCLFLSPLASHNN